MMGAQRFVMNQWGWGKGYWGRGLGVGFTAIAGLLSSAKHTAKQKKAKQRDKAE